jgi:hypothetical protein
LGSGWAALDPPGHPYGVLWTPPRAEPEPFGSQPLAPAAGSLGRPGRSAQLEYRRRPGPAPWSGGRR